MLDSKTYKLFKYCNASSEKGFPCPDRNENVPDGFQLKIAFEFDAENNRMYAETVRVSNCTNSFSIRMKGGSNGGFENTDNTF